MSCSAWQFFPKCFSICIIKLPPAWHGTAPFWKPEKPMAKLGNEGTFAFPFCLSIRSGCVLTASLDLNYLFVYKTRVLLTCVLIYRYACNIEVLRIRCAMFIVNTEPFRKKKIDFSFVLFCIFPLCRAKP